MLTAGYIIVDNEPHMNDSNDEIFNSTISMYQTTRFVSDGALLPIQLVMRENNYTIIALMII